MLTSCFVPVGLVQRSVECPRGKPANEPVRWDRRASPEGSRPRQGPDVLSAKPTGEPSDTVSARRHGRPCYVAMLSTSISDQVRSNVRHVQPAIRSSARFGGDHVSRTPGTDQSAGRAGSPWGGTISSLVIRIVSNVVSTHIVLVHAGSPWGRRRKGGGRGCIAADQTGGAVFRLKGPMDFLRPSHATDFFLRSASCAARPTCHIQIAI